MTEAEEQKSTEPGLDEVGAEAQPVKGRKKLFIIIGTIIILILIGIGLYFFLIKGKKKDAEHAESAQVEKSTIDEKQKKEEKQQDVFLELDEFLVNLDKGDKQASFLKMKIILQLANKEIVAKIQAKMPIIQDSFQVYLRELRADDLQGSSGVYILKEELLLRINKIMFPDKITNILFKEFLVQ